MTDTRNSCKKSKLSSCLICTGPAQAFNFGCLSCGSCKVFFRRASLQSKICKRYECRFHGRCAPDVRIRRCIACRLAQCYHMGMKRELVYLKSFNRRLNQHRNETIVTADRMKHSLTPFELQCLASIEEANKLFPDEKLLLDRGVPIKQADPIETINILACYINVLVRFANCFEQFTTFDTYNQAKLMKHFFDYFLTIRMSFNFNGDIQSIFLFQNEGNSLFTLDWQALTETLIRDEQLKQRLKAMIIEGSQALAGDPMVRNIMFVILLFQPNSQLTCNEFVLYYAHFYAQILKRVLVVKHQSHALGMQMFTRAMKIIDICKESRSVAHAFFDSLELSQVPHTISELYELI